MSGHWPPEWEDSEEEFSGENDQLDTEAEARLSEVAAFLATVPAPAMPDAVESRISAALATEAATRAESAAQPDGSPDRKAAAPANGARSLGPAPDRARVRRHRDGGGPRRRFRVRPQVVGGSLVTVLLVALVAFGLSRAGSSSSSSSAAAGSAAQPANAGASSAAASSAAGT